MRLEKERHKSVRTSQWKKEKNRNNLEQAKKKKCAKDKRKRMK